MKPLVDDAAQIVAGEATDEDAVQNTNEHCATRGADGAVAPDAHPKLVLWQLIQVVRLHLALRRLGVGGASCTGLLPLSFFSFFFFSFFALDCGPEEEAACRARTPWGGDGGVWCT